MKSFFNNVNVKLLTYYCLNGDYMLFTHNPLNNKTFNNVNVQIKTQIHKIGDIEFEEDVIEISNQELICCELISYTLIDEVLILKICQDWG